MSAAPCDEPDPKHFKQVLLGGMFRVLVVARLFADFTGAGAVWPPAAPPGSFAEALQWRDQPPTAMMPSLAAL